MVRTRERPGGRKPALRADMRLADWRAHYWRMPELVAFARRLGLARGGNKPELCARIERRLRRLPDAPRARAAAATRAAAGRDSDARLTRATAVVRYKSDERTRRFFESEIGPAFHFTYHLNQFRLRRRGLTYGDLVDEWLAERERRRSGRYRAPLAEHGRYNRFVRDFFADPANRGKSLRDASRAWNAVRDRRGGARYRRTR